MRIGVSLSSTSFENNPYTGASALIERARVANQAKLDLLSLGDHQFDTCELFSKRSHAWPFDG